MAWRTIASTETDPGAPGTSELFKALADNPAGIANADSGAPQIRTAALKSPASGTNNIIMRLQEIEVSTTLINYESVGYHNRYDAGRHLGVTVLVAGTITCSVDQKVTTNGTSYVRVLKNGTEVAELTTSSTSYVTQQTDVSVSVGDSVIFQHRYEPGSESSEWNNLLIYSATPDMAVA